LLEACNSRLGFGQTGKTKNASAGLSALPDFLGTVSLKDTPSGRTLQCLREPREAKAEIRSGQVNANRVTNFIEIALSDRVLFFPQRNHVFNHNSNIPGMGIPGL